MITVTAQVDEKEYGLLCNPSEAKVLLEALNRLYRTIYIESSYDPYNDYSREMCSKLLDDIQLVNKILKFRL